MADYSEGKIYLVKFKNDPSLVYVGSTKQPLNERFRLHKKDYSISLCKYIHDNYDGNWDDWYIELYEDYPCLNKEELRLREGEITLKFKNNSNYNCVNKYIAGRTMKEYYEDNKEKAKEKAKEYRENNKEIIKEYRKEYYKNNKEKILEYYENNKEKILEKNKEKFTCSCGVILTKNSLSRHLKTKKHLASL